MKAVAASGRGPDPGAQRLRTEVDDERGWDKALKRGYPCAELIDVAEGLPSSVDRVKVADDLRRAGCEPPSSFTGMLLEVMAVAAAGSEP